MYSSGMPSTTSSSAWPRMSRTFGGCDSVSIVSATAGLRRNAGSFRAFVAVHMTISVPFQKIPIGIDRGVPSSATYASLARSRASSSWLSGRFSTSSMACWSMVGNSSVVEAAGAGPDAGDVGAVDVQADGDLVADIADAVDVAGRREAADLAGRVVPRTNGVERFVEQFLVLDARQHAHDAPGDVVVDPGGLPGAPDQAEEGERPVGLGVQQVARDPVGLAETLVGRQDLGAGQVRAELVGDQVRSVRPAGRYV